MKNIHYVFMLLILCYCISESGVKEGYDFLIENRGKFDTLFNKELSCDYMSPHFKFIKYKKVNDILQDKNLTYNDSVASDLCRRFVDGISEISFKASCTRIVVDSTLFVFFSKILMCTNSNEKDVYLARLAAQRLIENAGFAELVKYKSILKPALQKSCIRYNSYCCDLAVLIGLNESEKKEYLEQDLSVCSRARIGDTSAMKILLKNYEESNRYSEKVNAIDRIMKSGNRELIKHVLLDFNDPIYRIKGYKGAPPCTSSSTQLQILQSLARYYPQNKLFNDELYKCTFDEYGKDSSFVKNYINLICEWMKKEYGIVPKSAFPPAYIIKRGCVEF